MAFEPEASYFVLVKSIKNKKIQGFKFPISEKNQTVSEICPFFEHFVDYNFSLGKTEEDINWLHVPLLEKNLHEHTQTHN